jgi:sulfur carrier protein
MPEEASRSHARLSIVLNGEAYETKAKSLDELVVEAALAGAKVATAVNGDFVPERDRRRRRLAPGDRIEILSPRQGG